VQSITALGAARAPQRDVATAACELVAGLEHLDGAAILKLDAGLDVAALAITGSSRWRSTIERICAAPAAFFAARGDGAWIGGDGSDLPPVAFAPLSVADRTIGVLVVGARPAAYRSGARLGDRLLAEAIDYAMVCSSVLGLSLATPRDPAALHDDILTMIAA